MTWTGKTLWYSIPRSLKRFLLTGCAAVTIDGAVYSALVHLQIEVSFAKAVGFVAGAVFAYFSARLWAFDDAQDARGSWLPFFALYLLALLLNVLVNKTSLIILSSLPYSYQTSWFVATGSSATLNYLGMRFFVFRKARAINV